jgi:hypothetical protein
VLSYLLLCLLLHWWPRRDWSLQPHLRWASSQTITRPSCRQCDKPSCRQCDNPTWSNTAFLSRLHARCRSSFQLHNRWSRLLGGSPVDSLQSHFILTMSHLSSELPICFRSQGTWVQIPWGDLCETGILLLVHCLATLVHKHILCLLNQSIPSHFPLCYWLRPEYRFCLTPKESCVQETGSFEESACACELIFCPSLNLGPSRTKKGIISSLWKLHIDLKLAQQR